MVYFNAERPFRFLFCLFVFIELLRRRERFQTVQHEMELLGMRMTMNIPSTCATSHYQPKGLSWIYNAMDFKDIQSFNIYITLFD